MDELSNVLIDLIVIGFNLLGEVPMLGLASTRKKRRILIVSCVGMVLAYILATLQFRVPYAVASSCFLSLPSLLLFYILSEFRDARFWLTFCFMDTLCIIIAFMGRISDAQLEGGSLLIPGILLVVLSGVYMFARRYFKLYTKLLRRVETGWRSMALTSGLFYVVLMFAAMYPKPIVQRPDAVPLYLLMCLTYFCCYGVFISSIYKTQQIVEQNQQLQEERRFYRIAFTDSLTETGNRAAYVEKLNVLERARRNGEQIWAVMLDLDGLKSMNDNYGHSAGDAAIAQAANVLKCAFGGPQYSIFRYGGDEFVILAERCSERELTDGLSLMEKLMLDTGCSFSYGYDSAGSGTIEQAVERADRRMYTHKRKKKLKKQRS